MFIKGPDDPLFKRFKTWFQREKAADATFPSENSFRKLHWSVIDPSSPTGPYRSEESWLARAVLTWVQEALSSDTFHRRDYRELCELINMILG